MRGEGTLADVRRSTADFREWRSCTSLFHHGDLEARRKTNDRKIGVHDCLLRVHSGLSAGSCRALLGLDGRGRPSPQNLVPIQTRAKPYTTPAVSCFIFSA